jgi:hypothetical protein
MTLDCAFVDLACFAAGQAYVALSRTRKIENLQIASLPSPSKIWASDVVKDYVSNMELLKRHCKIVQIRLKKISSPSSSPPSLSSTFTSSAAIQSQSYSVSINDAKLLLSRWDELNSPAHDLKSAVSLAKLQESPNRIFELIKKLTPAVTLDQDNSLSHTNNEIDSRGYSSPTINSTDATRNEVPRLKHWSAYSHMSTTSSSGRTTDKEDSVGWYIDRRRSDNTL